VNITTLSIGDELLYGETVDSNAAQLGERLYLAGFKVQRHFTVGDNEQDIMEAIEILTERSDVVIVTGGLGPTIDDITARAAAKITSRRLILNDEALTHLQQFSEKLGKELHPANEKQALLPAKSTVIPNPLGTACGFALTHKGRFLFFLPGVPREMVRMLDDTVIPFILPRRKQKTVILTKVLKVFGLEEAAVGALLQEVALPDAGITTAFCVAYPEILIKFRAEGTNGAELTEALDKTWAAAKQLLRGYVFAEDGETMDSTVAALFRATGMTLALAESCTGGMVAARITDIPGSSAYFLEGVVTYSNSAKERTLLVPATLLAEKGAVSAEVAKAMAREMRRRTGSDIALAITGIAGPDGGTPGKPVGTLFLALADSAGCQTKRYTFHGNRSEIRLMTSFTAMDWLRRRLSSIQGEMTVQ
jgi:nicotinamide-nucleotide amidase